jgi:hypothetical protein
MQSTVHSHATGPKVELGRYDTEQGQRVLVGRRIEGEVFVYDHPVGPGRPYFVERGFELRAELAILVAEYRRRASELGVSPMSTEAIGRGLALAAGTVPSWTTTHRTSGHLLPTQTGEGTRTRAREFLIGPDEFKRLGTGEAVVIQPRAKHPAEIVSVWPPHRGEG